MTHAIQAINYEDTTLLARLHVAPDFTGRVMAYIENGELKADMRLRQSEIVGSLESFIEAARSAGWTVCPPHPQMD